nr:FkbM family methyltransferase [uncultured Flavobacterium sp.]
MKNSITAFLLFLYHKVKRSHLLRKWIKKLIGSGKIALEFNGFKMYAGVTSAIESNVVFNSYNEIKVLELISRLASNGYHFIDIGANIGIHSMTAAKANPDIEIFSFEPESNNFTNFLQNIGLNQFDNIRPFKMGLGNFKGNTFMNINEGWNKGKHSLKVNFQENDKKITIPVNQLDSFKEYVTGNKLLLKIDVEGFEKEVLEGAKTVVSQVENGVIIIELVTEINSLETCHEIVNLLSTYGFDQMYKINTENKLATVHAYEGSADYVFVKGTEAPQFLF